MGTALERLTIGAFAAEAEVKVETVRYYHQRKGLLAKPDRPSGSIRRYGDADVARVKFIKAAQRLGFSLGEIMGLLAARALGQHKLDDVRKRLADLRRIESAMARMVKDCDKARGTVSGPLIAALQLH